jgi:hypothetical protein
MNTLDLRWYILLENPLCNFRWHLVEIMLCSNPMWCGFVFCYWSALWSVWKRFHLWQIRVLSEWRWTSSGNWFLQVCFIYLNDPLALTIVLVKGCVTHHMILFLCHFSNLFRVFGCTDGSTEATTLEASKNPMRYIWVWIKEISCKW